MDMRYKIACDACKYVVSEPEFDRAEHIYEDHYKYAHKKDAPLNRTVRRVFI